MALSSDAWKETRVRFCRDDTSVWVLRFETENSGGPKGALQIPPLRFAPVGMTKGSGALSISIGLGMTGPQTALSFEDGLLTSAVAGRVSAFVCVHQRREGGAAIRLGWAGLTRDGFGRRSGFAGWRSLWLGR